MEQVNLRAKYDAQYASARANLGAVVLLSLVNVVLMVLDAGVSFLFSAVLPQVAINYGWYLDAWLGGSTYTIIAYAISALWIGAFALCYYLSKKHPGCMTAALVLFCLDCLVLVYWIYLGFMMEDVLDIVFHVWILYYLIRGVVAARKRKTLPEAPVPPAPGAPTPNMNAASVQNAAPVQPGMQFTAPMQNAAPVQNAAPAQPMEPAQPVTQPAVEASPVETAQPAETAQPEAAPAESAAPEREPNFGPQPPMGPASME